MRDTDDKTRATDEWLDLSTYLPSITGFAQASELLNDPRLKADYHSLFAAVGASQGRAGEAGKRSLLNLNGEEHKRLRSKVAPEFRPRSVDRIRPFAHNTAHSLFRELPESQFFDFMCLFAKPYTERTTGEYIGFPATDLDSLTLTIDQINEAVGDLANRASDFDAGCTELLDYAIQALIERRDRPTDDVLGHLAQLLATSEIDELFAANLIVTLLAAGLEPTILQMGLIVEEFSKRPEVWDMLAANNDLVPAVLEELLRLRSTNQGVVRSIDKDVALQGVHFKKGSQLLVNIAAANQDCRRFAKPDSFDLAANRGSHLAFGFGPHHCLGAPLVRAQLQEAITVLVNEAHCPRVINVHSKTGTGLVGPLKLIIEMTSRK
jgi:cytochrome P450